MVCNKKRKPVFIKWKWNHVVFSRATILSFNPVYVHIFISKGFQTIVFIFIVISTTFRPMCPPSFFRCLANSGTITELRTTSFIESTGVACSDSVSHNRVQVLSIPVLLLACSQDWSCNPQTIIILIIMSCHQHGYLWPSLSTPPYRPSLPAGLQGYIPYLHRAAVCRFEQVALPLLSHVRGVHRSISLMSSSLLLQQCSACLVHLILIVFVMVSGWPYSCCFVWSCLQDLFNIAPSILV